MILYYPETGSVLFGLRCLSFFVVNFIIRFTSWVCPTYCVLFTINNKYHHCLIVSHFI